MAALMRETFTLVCIKEQTMQFIFILSRFHHRATFNKNKIQMVFTGFLSTAYYFGSFNKHSDGVKSLLVRDYGFFPPMHHVFKFLSALHQGQFLTIGLPLAGYFVMTAVLRVFSTQTTSAQQCVLVPTPTDRWGRGRGRLIKSLVKWLCFQLHLVDITIYVNTTTTAKLFTHIS